MKKILIGILIILLIVMACFAIFKGISVGNFKILSVYQIQEKNNQLTEEITKAETLIQSSYRNHFSQLDNSVSRLLAAKEEYKNLEDISTEGEIKQANKEEVYKIEYLWTRIGSHATGEGVILKLDVTAGETGESDVKNLSFTVTGNYIAIINFVRSIEDDSQLGFRIENFKMIPGSDTDARQATFVVRNVRIKQENTSTGVISTNNETSQNKDENNNTVDNKEKAE